MVAEDRLNAKPRERKDKISAVFEWPPAGTRYHLPLANPFNRETQVRLARAFAQLLAWADHQWHAWI